MQTVARIIGGKSGLGVTRQIFYVQLGSFDTHDGQAHAACAAADATWPGT